MPYRPRKPCHHPGCPNLTEGMYCTLHQPQHKPDTQRNVINLKRILNGKQNVWQHQNGEEKSDSDGREKDV